MKRYLPLLVLLFVLLVGVVILKVNTQMHFLNVASKSATGSNTPALEVPSAFGPVQVASDKTCPQLSGGWWEAKHYFEIASQTFPVDCSTFEYFSNTYAKDAHAVYFFKHSTTSPDVVTQIIVDADPASFTARVWAPFGVDKQHVFFLSQLISGADPITFFHVDPQELSSPYFFHYYYRDAHSVYVLTLTGEGLVKLIGANPATFLLVGENGIAKDDAHVYVAGREMSGIDAKSFSFFSGELYKDASHVFYFDLTTKELQESSMQVDVATLRALLGASFTGAPSYIMDAHGVYFKGKKIDGADPETFVLFDPNDRSDGYGGSIGDADRYAHDKSHVYFRGILVEGADPSSFQVISTGGYADEFGKDTAAVFYFDKKIDVAQPDSFTPLTFQVKEGCRPGPYSKDAQYVYFGAKRVVGADQHTFKVDDWGSGPYGRDSVHVFENGMIRPDLDVTNFKSQCNYG